MVSSRAFEMDVPNQSPCSAIDACHVAGVRDRRGNLYESADRGRNDLQRAEVHAPPATTARPDRVLARL